MNMPFPLVLLLGLGLAACSSTSDDVATRNSSGQSFSQSTQTSVAATPQTVARIPSIADLISESGGAVLFEYDSAALTPQSRRVIERWAEVLRRADARNVAVLISGHADERGTREYNIALGERRAMAAKAYLVSLGVETMRVHTISFGKERPQAVGSDERAWAQNRRAVASVN